MDVIEGEEQHFVQKVGNEADGEGRDCVASEGLRNGVLQVLLLSSIPRSGSTLLAELLATTHHNSVLFFEPLSNHRKNPCYQDGSCVKDLLKSLFQCTYEQDFENWLKGKGLFLKYYHSSVRRCFQRPREGGGACRRELALRSLCQNATVRIAKVIRSRLSWLEGLLNDTLLQVKIVHLLRDPRASLTSIKQLGWKSEPLLRCQALEKDIQEYNELLIKYPSKVISFTQESFSVDPVATTRDLHMFLYGNDILGTTTHQYLKEHMKASGSRRLPGDTMDTHRNSREEHQAWRWKITGRLLKETEGEAACRAVITQMGHTLFGSLQNCRNSSYSLATHTNYATGGSS